MIKSKIESIRKIVKEGGKLNEQGSAYLFWYCESQALELRLLHHQVQLGVAGVSLNCGYWASVASHQRRRVDSGESDIAEYQQMMDEGIRKLNGMLVSSKCKPVPES